MSNGKNKILELKNEFCRFKEEFDETINSHTTVLRNLEASMEEEIRGNQIKLNFNNTLAAKKRCKPSLPGEKKNIQSTVEMAEATVHELLQPLAVLIRCCELLGMLADQSPEIKTHIDSILSNANKINGIIEKIQSINKQMTEQCDELYMIKETK
ncbi:hypothetical protein ACFL6I_01120 [candidate division KSB1 bacterium]